VQLDPIASGMCDAQSAVSSKEVWELFSSAPLTDGINSVALQIDDPGFNAKMAKSM
jgi:hypothetical protein